MRESGDRTPPFDPLAAGVALAEVAWAPLAGGPALRVLQARRLARLLRAAQHASPLYRTLLRGLDPDRDDVLQLLPTLPVLRKAALMAQFDGWVGDPALRLADLRRFTADPTRIGDAYLGRYLVWESSGSRGEPGIFVQDAAALAVYDALEALRRPWSPRRLLDPWYAGEVIALVGATGGHFASVVSTTRLRRLNPAMAQVLHEVSFLQPPEALAARLNALQPTLIGSYPTAAIVLAELAEAGRLTVHPREIRTGGETLTAPMRQRLQRVFGCPVIDSYGASEFFTIACECPQGRLHLNSDWVILEPVDAHGRPVTAGTSGASVLLTNLANTVQPLIRYDLGDRVRLPVERCACGSPLPLLEVAGRSDDLLHLPAARGAGLVALAPLALCTVLEDAAGLFDFRLEQLAPAELLLSVPGHGAAATAALERGQQALAAYFDHQGVGRVRLQRRSGRPGSRGRGGKLQRVVALAADPPA